MALLSLLPLIGFALFIHIYFKKLFSVSLFVSVSLLIVSLFLFGMVSALQTGAMLMFSVGAILLLYSLFRFGKDVSKTVVTPPFVIFSVMSIVAFFVFRDSHLFFWDEYSHWGVFIKEMYFTHHFYDVNTPAPHLNYPPGISLWDYFVLMQDNAFVEGHLYFAYFIVLFSATLMMYEKIGWKSWYQLLLVFVLQMVIFASFGHGFTNTYVDHVVGAMFAGLLLSFLSERFEGYSYLLLSFPLMGIVLVKEVGLFFGFAAVGMYLLLAIMRRKETVTSLIDAFKAERKSIIVLGLSLVLMMGVLRGWESHQRSEGIPAEKQSIGGIVTSVLSDKKTVPEEVEEEIRSRFWEVVFHQQIHKEALSLNYNEFSYSLMPQYKKQVKLSTVGFLIFFILMIGVRFKLTSDAASRRETLWIGIYLSAVFLAYLVILYMSYLVAFGNGGVRIPSYVRYINMASMPLLFTAFALFMPMYTSGIGISRRRQTGLTNVEWGGVGFIILLTLIVQPYFRPLYAQLENGFRQKLHPAAKQIVDRVPGGSKLYVVFVLKNNGMFDNVVKYELLPAYATLSGADFGSRSPADMAQTFTQYDYVWFAAPDRQSVNKNASLLKMRNNGQPYTLYQVGTESGNLVLKPVQ